METLMNVFKMLDPHPPQYEQRWSLTSAVTEGIALGQEIGTDHAKQHIVNLSSHILTLETVEDVRRFCGKVIEANS
jgi:hypothetical protein